MNGTALNNDSLIESLLDPSAYVHCVTGPVVLHETHTSWVLLAGNFAYNIKKPIVTDFLDYGTLPKRHHACCEEPLTEAESKMTSNGRALIRSGATG